MTILAGIAIAVSAFFTSGWFWTCARAPIHLLSLLGDQDALSGLIHRLGPAELVKEAKKIRPVFGSYAANIAAFDAAHKLSLTKPRNFALFMIAAEVVAAYLVSVWCLFAVIAMLILPAVYPVAQSAKQYNANHVRSVLLNLLKWHQEDAAGCQEYCTSRRPELSGLHRLVMAMVTKRGLKRLETARAGKVPRVKLPTVVLTDEEQRECEAFQASMMATMAPQDEEGQWFISEDLAEPFKRNLSAMCMMNRAERFSTLERDQLEGPARACEAAAKACAIYPLSVYFFDFACILEELGRDSEALTMFEEFMHRRKMEPSNELDALVLKQRDLAMMVKRAQNRLQGSAGES